MKELQQTIFNLQVSFAVQPRGGKDQRDASQNLECGPSVVSIWECSMMSVMNVCRFLLQGGDGQREHW